MIATRLLHRHAPARAVWTGAAIGFALIVLGQPASAQNVRPSDDRIELPEPTTSKPQAPPELRIESSVDPSESMRVAAPAAPLPPLDDLLGDSQSHEVRDDDASTAPSIVVSRLVFVGNTALTHAELDRVAAPWLGHPLDGDDVRALRDALTLAYVERGYVTSGARISPAALGSDGALTIEIVEGELGDIELVGKGRLRARYLTRRLERGASRPLDLGLIERTLARLQRDPRVKRVNATLRPSTHDGLSILQVDVEEADPWSADLGVRNAGAPPVGEWRGFAGARHANLTGWGDTIGIDYEGGNGLQQLSALYSLPITRFDTALELSTVQIWSRITEDPLSQFDITSRLETYRIGVAQPVWHNDRHSVVAHVGLEWRAGTTYLEGEPFSFVPGPENGRVAELPLRFAVDWRWQAPRFALAMRNQLTVGIPASGMTRHSGGVPDGRFLSWLLQLQVARQLSLQLDKYDPTVVARFESQLASSSLLSIEQYALGGLRSVRGVRANSVVRDQGLFGSLEIRQPVPTPRMGAWRPAVELAAFTDVGQGWNHDAENRRRETLWSAGLGARASLFAGALAEIYWAAEIEGANTFDSGTLQDHGVYFSLAWRY